MNRSRLAFALGLLAPALLLGGCSDDPVPKVAPASESASASESPSPSGSSDPGDEDQKALINSYFAAVGDSTTTGDTSAFLKMSSRDCQNCRTLANNIEGAYENGGHVEGGNWDVVEIASSSMSSDVGSVWNVDVQTSLERWYDGSGKLTKIVRASTQHFGVLISRQDGHPIVRDLRLRG